MSKLKQYATILAANMAMAAMNKGNLYDENEFFENEFFNSPKLYCKDCIYYPNGNKTFCKYAKHSINKRTPANNCKYFENEINGEIN